MYITIEGAEATGKSTQARLLAEALSKKGHRAFLTKEPGSPHDPVCKSIRELLLRPDHMIDRKCALFLFMADRAQHMQHVKKALADGAFVISDRSSISSFIYYTAETRDIIYEDEDKPICLMLDQAQQVAPDICFVCSADVDVAGKHLAERASLDRIERKPPQFHANVHRLFESDRLADLCGVLDLAPHNIYWPPSTYVNSVESITDFMLAKIEGSVECQKQLLMF